MRRNEREVTSSSETEEIINSSDVCRIAFADQNTPYIVTMNFGFEGRPVKRLFFHCALSGRKLEILNRNNLVCFEMDTDHAIFPGVKGCDWGMKYRSVVGYGKITILTDKDSRKNGMNKIMEHYGGKKDYIFDERVFEKTLILMLEISEMTAKKC
jgi:nitroimidazol reductase NimA-like FMN-containing flavoprotein (pyridoxamine 5'-phosphate oxidase superfamily)